jgi:SAM-dependent methyltransferase
LGLNSVARDPEFERRVRLQTEAFARNTPYHSLELLDGTVLPGLIPVPNLRARLDAYPLPQDLRGMRVLDIGAASGWNSFECERRGAEVVAVDYVEYEEFTAVKRLRDSKIEYAIAEIEEITPERFGRFDYVLFFGVLYHLRHPLLGLERVCSVTSGVALVESFTIDAEPSRDRCFLEFYETDELGGQIDNWCGPTTQCIMAMTRAAGFPRVDLLYVDQRRAGLVAHRRWGPVHPSPGARLPFLCSALNNRHNDNIFQPGKDEYASIWFRHSGELRREDILIEIDEFGMSALILKHHGEDLWQVNAKLPPGLDAGDHQLRVGTCNDGFSDTFRIRILLSGVDRTSGGTEFCGESETIPPPARLRAENTMDRTTTFHDYRGESLALRFIHEGEKLDLSRVQLTVNDQPWPLLSVEQPEPGWWQVNARLRGLRPGQYSLRLRTSWSGFSDPVQIESCPDSA